MVLVDMRLSNRNGVIILLASFIVFGISFLFEQGQSYIQNGSYVLVGMAFMNFIMIAHMKKRKHDFEDLK